jgi:lipopolysaccharide transport system ATP-binding protein
MGAVIKVENLGKKYVISHQRRESRGTLRDAMTRTARGAWQRVRHPLSPNRELLDLEEMWALRDVSFEVQQGERLGIIGRNGAGKSTLLKILSRITQPTTGRVHLRGRVSSLLEVGTGFHPELTGRENIFLNGAILGMARQEIKKKFDEIVAFAETEKFLDTAVKHYSSGMYVRLAFAVAAHLEPEILIVDEVLAVGDVAFQKKCLGKMESVAREGRTVLFVSHNMDAIDKMTSHCAWLDAGQIKSIGASKSVVKGYLEEGFQCNSDLSRFRISSLPGTASLTELAVEDVSRNRFSTFRQGEPFSILLRIECQTVSPVDAAVVVENAREQALFTTHLTDMSEPIAGNGGHLLSIQLDKPALRRGKYLVSVALFSPDKHSFYDVVYHFPLFEIAGTLDPRFIDDTRWGDLYLPIQWKRLT